MKQLLLFFAIVFSLTLSAQNFNMVPGTNGGNGFLYTGCSALTFYDSGGPQGNYGNNEDNIAVFCPDIDTDLAELNFVRLGLGAGDTLTIYDGDSTASPVLVALDATSGPTGLLRASAATPGGCLTVRFRSNGSTTGTGWAASRGCFNPCQAISTTIITTPAADADGIIRICQGDTINFEGSAIFSNGTATENYSWDLGNGAGVVSGAIQSETYITAQSYPIRFFATDEFGCSDRTDIEMYVHVSTDPDFTGTRAEDSIVCFGETTELFGVVQPTEYSVEIAPPITGTTFLPDLSQGPSVFYRTCVNVEGFPLGATLNNASDILDIFVNMEHSWTSDINIELTSPSGASIFLFSRAGGGTFLGEPIDDDAILDPGIGYDYFFTESRAATRTLTQAAVATAGGVSIPSGDFLPEDPFTGLVGSALNGDWCLTITDFLQSDNGYIFYWGMNFDPTIIPDEVAYTPQPISTRWLPNPDIIADNGDQVTVQPSIQGVNCYTFEFTDSFDCVYTEEVCVNTSPEIPVGVPNDFTICDTGITTTVDLRVNNSLLLNGLDPGQYQVNYYTDEDAANAGNGRITNTAAYPFGTTTQTIYGSVTNILTGCNNVQPIVINIIDFSSISIPAIEVCEPIVSFDLEQYIRDNTSVGDSADIVITVHDSQNDADSGANPVQNIDSYDQGFGTEQFFVKFQSSTDVSCAGTSELIIDVVPGPSPVALDDLSECSLTTEFDFDLTVSGDLIENAQSPQNPNLLIEYFTDAALDPADLIATPASYTNTSSPQTIFIKVTDPAFPECFLSLDFVIDVSIEPIFNTVDDMVKCDTGNDDEEVFDLTSSESDIINGQTGLQISYHDSMNNALSGASPIINPESYTNNIAPIETIYVRLLRSDNSVCRVITGTFNLELITEPVVNPVNDIIVCDLGSDGEESFDFDPLISQILLSQAASVYNVTFHDDLGEAQLGQDDLPLTDYENSADTQIIYIRVEVASSPDCFTTGEFQIGITPLPVLTAAGELSQCDDLSGDGVEIFNLRDNESVITASVGNSNLTVTYHDSQNSANDGSSPLNTMYENTASTETIYVRVVDNDTTCISTTSFEIIVLPIPDVGNPVALEECDVSGSRQANFTLSENNSLIIDGQTNMSVTYYETRTEALAGGLGLDDQDFENNGSPQSIFYRIENNSTLCFNVGEFQIEAVDAPVAIMPSSLDQCDNGNGRTTIDLNQLTNAVTGGQTDTSLSFFESQADAEANAGAVSRNYQYSQDTTIFIRVDDDNTDCVSYTTVELIFNELPDPRLLPEYLLCVDENGNLINGPENLNTGLDNASHTFEWYLEGVLIAGANNAIYAAGEPGNYEVIVTEIATGCENSTTTFVRQLGAPETYDVSIITDPFSFNHDVIATATGPDEYWFSLDDGPYLYTGNFENVLPGPHKIAIAERNGCGELIEEIFVFGYPDFFTPNDDGYHDTWNIIGGDRLQGTIVYVYDRYGKLIKQIDPAGAGWDGTFNGQPLPSTDYWFQINYEFDGVQAEARGHFAMKR
jgi:gliding motility-associated-like protein